MQIILSSQQSTPSKQKLTWAINVTIDESMSVDFNTL